MRYDRRVIERISLEPVDSVEILTLVDNSSDLLLRSEDRARRPAFADGVSTGFAAARPLADALPDAFLQNGVGTRFRI